MKKLGTLGVLLLFLSGLFSCTGSSPRSLKNTNWEVVYLDGISQTAIDTMRRRPTIQFTDSSTINGFAGCNYYFGRYSVEGSQIDIEAGGATLMFCLDMAVEDAFMTVVPDMNMYEIEGDSILKLFNHRGELGAQLRKIAVVNDNR